MTTGRLDALLHQDPYPPQSSYFSKKLPQKLSCYSRASEEEKSRCLGAGCHEYGFGVRCAESYLQSRVVHTLRFGAIGS